MIISARALGSMLTLALIGSIAAGGCGSEGISLEWFHAESVAIECGHFYACCDEEGLRSRLSDPPETPEACAEERHSMYEQLFDRMRTEIAEGKLVFRGDLAMYCLNELREASCADFFLRRLQSAPICVQLFEGQVPLGGACTVDYHCGEGAHCAEELDHRCALLPGDGEPCYGIGERCDVGLVCLSPFGDVPRCGKQRLPGAPCGSFGDCESQHCAGPEDARTCAPPQVVGGPCNAYFECASGRCEMGVCKARTADGKPCTADVLCASGYCDRETNTCAPLTDAAICKRD
ncbi:hypothetical protein [Polyangium aurulentum]|uniref:hypothetical protein n=1 Tax=Polyangium aurulentum TaxID=2567896 RepID=UPI0010AEDE7D|nr:hypothetical protein [Polyangium aurulentum]UQA55620.1 hypothetical protein E8A73_030300 [Polyangium aurulentum]